MPDSTARADERVDRDDRALLRVLAGDWERAVARAGERLACRPGCDACCIGPFPITRLDVLRLVRGLRELERDRPETARRVRERARTAARILAPGFPGDPATGRLADDEAALDAFLARHETLPCPALDPSGRTCDLYAWRPVSCRTFGPPARFGSTDVPPCNLCFRGESADVVDRCRVAPDAGGLEERILSALGPDGDTETLVALALDSADGSPVLR